MPRKIVNSPCRTGPRSLAHHGQFTCPLRWPKRAIPSFPYGRTSILPSALPYFYRRFHTSILHPRTAKLVAHAQSMHIVFCSSAKCAQTSGSLAEPRLLGGGEGLEIERLVPCAIIPARRIRLQDFAESDCTRLFIFPQNRPGYELDYSLCDD